MSTTEQDINYFKQYHHSHTSFSIQSEIPKRLCTASEWVSTDLNLFSLFITEMKIKVRLGWIRLYFPPMAKEA